MDLRGRREVGLAFVEPEEADQVSLTQVFAKRCVRDPVSPSGSGVCLSLPEPNSGGNVASEALGEAKDVELMPGCGVRLPFSRMLGSMRLCARERCWRRDEERTAMIESTPII